MTRECPKCDTEMQHEEMITGDEVTGGCCVCPKCEYWVEDCGDGYH